MTKPWYPSNMQCQRISGRLLRAHRASVVALTGRGEVFACIEGCTLPVVPRRLRRQLGEMWRTYGPTLIESCTEDPARRKPLDDALDRVVLG
jgi:hypothetical protein